MDEDGSSPALPTMFLKIPRTASLDWGKEVAFHYLEVDPGGAVQRVVDIDSESRAILRSPTTEDRYTALDHPPLADPASWLEFEISASEFERVWGSDS